MGQAFIFREIIIKRKAGRHWRCWSLRFGNHDGSNRRRRIRRGRRRPISVLCSGVHVRVERCRLPAVPAPSRQVYAVRGAAVGVVRGGCRQGFYIITYGLGIYVLNLFIAFLSPQEDPEMQDLLDGPSLPTKSTDEFRPFVRRLPEFKFWYSITKTFCIAFTLTFSSAFDVPVFWPILLFYWLVLFTATMKRQILHMIKYKYVPFTMGKKQRYTKKRASSDDDASLPVN